MKTLFCKIAFAVLLILAGCSKQRPVAPDVQQLSEQASLAMYQDEHERAADLLYQATERAPEFAEVWIGLGMALVQMNQTQKACSAYEQALVLHSDRYENDQSPNELQQQAFVLLLLRRDEEATALVNYGRDAHSDDPVFMRFADEFPELAKSGFTEWQIGNE